MLFDFIQQSFYSAIFFFGIAGIGLYILDILLPKEDRNVFHVASAYFFSLCIFTLLCVFGLFLFDDKREFVKQFTIVYFLISAGVIFQIFFDIQRITSLLKEKYCWIFGISFLGLFFLFFLQIYHTSILDEWLHRPVVNSFVQNGVFPLVNPLNVDQSFIYTYHYGVHVIGSSLAMLFRLGISESLDLFKLANFIGAFLLFYGILRNWLVSQQRAMLFTGALLFLGSSFFLADTFTTSHLKKISPFDFEWPSNVAISFGLSGITSIGVLLGLVFFFVFTDVIKNQKKFRPAIPIVVGFLFSGFMLLGEYYAALILLYGFSLNLVLLLKKRINLSVSLGSLVLFLVVFIPAVYYSGGLGGAMLNSVSNTFHSYLTMFSPSVVSQEKIESSTNVLLEHTPSDGRVEASIVMIQNRPIFAFKNVSDWGYPSERSVVKFFEKPVYYLRTFLLEFLLIVFVVWMFVRKKIVFSSEDLSLLIFSLVLVGIPFFITTAFGDLNLAKSLVLGFALVHLYCIKVLFQQKTASSRYAVAFFKLLFFFGSLPSMLLGSNIQWQWLSSRGKSQYCSQNPLCYKGELTELLKKFEKEYPGLKHVAINSKEAKNVVDLTHSYVYRYSDRRAEYIIDTPEGRNSLSDSEKERLSSLNTVIELGENKVLQVK